MILLAYVLCAAIVIACIAFCHTHRQMNAAALGFGAACAAITGYILIFVQVPVGTLIVGNGYFFIDHFGLFEVAVATAIFLLAAVYARGYVENLIISHELETGSLKLFYGAWCLLELVIVLAFYSDNLALFWIFAEMTTIISAMLVAILSAKENIDAALKYIFVASVSMLIAFAGLIFLFEIARSTTGTGSLNWTVLIQQAPAFPPGMAIAAFALIFVGFAAKSGIFPFHTWLPEAHAKAPSAVSAVLSGVLLNVGIYGIIRVFAIVHRTTAVATASLLVLFFGVCTIGIAAISMLPEKNLKKMIAFSSIENMGICLVGLAVATPLALFWVLFHVMAHAFTKASLFFSAGILHRQYRSHLSADAPDEIRDVFRFQPLAAWGIIIGGLAIIGMPPFAVFFSKFFILLSLGSLSLWVLVLVLALLFVAAAALGYFVIRSFSRVTPEGEPLDLVPYQTPLAMKAPIVILLAAVLLLAFLFPMGGTAYFDRIVAELMFV
jgi:hydrogenase-4 component F